ncbi:MAG: biopolymer transporter ExbD, partial [Bacteroidota bacterium]
SKVSAEFNMSSLTDIIFLLLIFFMLTSTLVAPNSINFNLPGSKQKRVESTRNTDEIRINKRGLYYFNDRSVSIVELEDRMSRMSGRGGAQPVVVVYISPQANVEKVAAVMDIALRYDIKQVTASRK